MTFKEARALLIEALKTGSYQHEYRDAQREKNLLAVGDIEAIEVIDILKACTGRHHYSESHYVLKNIDVHIFTSKKLIRGKGEWFVRAYFLGYNAWFISVHPAERRIGL